MSLTDSPKHGEFVPQRDPKNVDNGVSDYNNIKYHICETVTYAKWLKLWYNCL